MTETSSGYRCSAHWPPASTWPYGMQRDVQELPAVGLRVRAQRRGQHYQTGPFVQQNVITCPYSIQYCGCDTAQHYTRVATILHNLLALHTTVQLHFPPPPNPLHWPEMEPSPRSERPATDRLERPTRAFVSKTCCYWTCEVVTSVSRCLQRCYADVGTV